MFLRINLQCLGILLKFPGVFSCRQPEVIQLLLLKMHDKETVVDLESLTLLIDLLVRLGFELLQVLPTLVFSPVILRLVFRLV